MRAESKLTLTGGLYAGLIGYGTVVVVVAVMNVLGGRSPFHTAALFGSALFYGLDDPAQVHITAGPVLSYNMVHMLVFLGLGLIASWLVTLAEKYPTAQYVVLVVLVAVAFHVFAGLVFFASPLLGRGAWTIIGIGTVAGAVLMGGYLFWLHPALRRELRDIPMGDVPGE